MKKKVVPLQELVTFMRDVAYSDNQSHKIDWSMSIIHPSTNDGCMGYSGGLWNSRKANEDGFRSISFSYDEVKGITNFKTWIEHAEIRHDCGDKPTFEEFKPICLKMFSVKKLYREA